MDTKLIMVRGRTSDRVGDALSRMLEGTKPRQAEHTATAGEPVNPPAPAPHLSPEPPALPSNPNGGSTAGADHTHQSAPALSLVWDRDEIKRRFEREEIDEDDAIDELCDAGMDVFTAMEFLDSWA